MLFEPDESGLESKQPNDSASKARKAKPLKKAKLLEPADPTEPAGQNSTGSSPQQDGIAQPISVSKLAASGASVAAIQQQIRKRARQQAAKRQAASQEAAKQQATVTVPDDKSATETKAAVHPAFAVVPPPQEDEDEEQSQEFQWTRDYSCFACSTLFHMVLLLVLGLWVIHDLHEDPFEVFTSYVEPEVVEELEQLEVDEETPEFEPQLLKEVESQDENEVFNAEDLDVVTEVLDELEAGAESAQLDDSDDVSDLLAASDWWADLPAPKANGEGTGNSDVRQGGTGQGQGEGVSGAGRGRGGRAARRKKIMEDDPYAPEIEPVVERSLMWLAHHQLPDGGWSYQHQLGGDCKGQCGNPGELANARYAATGMALLPFLGAGYTYLDGPYKKNVYNGLLYLIRNQANDGGLWGPQGRMYGHGIATLALCEAFAIAREAGPNSELGDVDQQIDFNNRLGRAARSAANFINKAQAPDGGWRYNPKQLGDTSVVGWQIMALKAAKDAGLTFSPAVRQAAHIYLNSVQSELVGDDVYGRMGTVYAYQAGSHVSKATSAIGVLCRIYMGTPTHHPAVIQVANQLAQQGPSAGDMYFNYYATQLMFQHGGDQWKQWYRSMSGSLKNTQAQAGHLAGSWYFAGGDAGASKGGRLYCTVLSLLCLEEHYRHLRIADGMGVNIEAQMLDEDKQKQEAAGAGGGAKPGEPNINGPAKPAEPNINGPAPMN